MSVAELTEDEERVIEVLRQRSATTRLPKHREELREAVQARDADRKAIKFKTYKLLAGTHAHFTKAEQKKTEELNKDPKRAGMPVDPEMITYRPGDEIVPLSVAEALMMDQNPEKFMALDSNTTDSQKQLADVLAENERLKAQLAKAREDKTGEDKGGKK